MELVSYYTANAYDNLGRPTIITTPDGGATHMTYNKSGWLFSLHVTNVGTITPPLSTDIINEIYYNAKGQRTKIKYENGASTTYHYDPNTYRVSRIHTTRSSDSAQLQDLNYWYDPVGNITWQTDDAQDVIFYDGSMAGPENKYTYDALYRLIICEGREHAGSTNAINASDGARMGNIPLPADASALRRYTQKYTHDAVGNMLQMQHITSGTGSWTRNMPVSGSRNHINSSTIGSDAPLPETYLHDGWGNIVRGFNHLHTAGGTSNSMFYNWENRLERILISGSITTYYQYDADGQRVRKTTINTAAALKQVRKYVGRWEQYQKIDTGTNFIILERETLHVADGEGRVAIINTPTIDTLSSGEVQTLRYQLSNHIGSASLELDEVADIISYEEYYPFGNTSYQCGRNAAECSLKRYRYVGKERDDESGFYYMGARYYCPWLARWLAVDPINGEWYNMCMGVPQRNTERQFVELTASSYEYCYANPVRFTDPSGEQVEHDPVWNFKNLFQYDMNNAPQNKNKNAAGYQRNGNWVAKQYLAKVPEAFSPENVSLIGKNKMPKVDETWLKHTEERNASQRTYLNDDLVHHHNDQGKMATLLPKTFHEKFTKALHPVRNVAKHLESGGKALGFIGNFADIISYKAGNPDSWVSMFSSPGENPIIGKVYNDWGSVWGNNTNRYFTPVSSKDLGDGQIKYELDIYSTFKWSDKENKYIGENKIGHETIIRDLKNGGELDIMTDNSGKVINKQDTRKRSNYS